MTRFQWIGILAGLSTLTTPAWAARSSNKGAPPPPAPSYSSSERREIREREHEEESKDGFAVGASYIMSNVIGDQKHTFKDGMGGQGEIWLPNFLGERSLSLHGSVGVTRFNIANLDSYSLLQVTFLAGFEFMAPKGFFIRPFGGIDIGVAYDRLQSPGSDVTLNAAAAFTAQFRPGLSFQIADPVAINLAMPFTAYIADGQLLLLNLFAGVKVQL